MRMSIWWGCDIGDFLFYGFKVTSPGGLVATCFLTATLAFAFEGCKLLQAKHRQRQLSFRAEQIRNICPTESATLLDEKRGADDHFSVNLKKRMGLPFFDVLLWLFMHNMGYLIMLTVMIYNGWIFLSVVLGSGLGYFVFGQTFMKINLKNCQLMKSAFCSAACNDPELSNTQRDGESTPALQSSSTTEIRNCHDHTMATVHVDGPEASTSATEQIRPND